MNRSMWTSKEIWQDLIYYHLSHYATPLTNPYSKWLNDAIPSVTSLQSFWDAIESYELQSINSLATICDVLFMNGVTWRRIVTLAAAILEMLKKNAALSEDVIDFLSTYNKLNDWLNMHSWAEFGYFVHLCIY